MKTLFLICLLAIGISTQAQVAINTDGTTPDNSAMLDVKSTIRGLLAPRMTLAQRNAIVTPATGLLVFQTNDIPGYYYNAGTPAVPLWALVGSNAGQWLSNGTSIYYNLGNVGIGTSTPGQDLDIRGLNTDDGGALSVGNSDLTHRLVLFGGRLNDPNPFIWWKDGDPLRFATDEGGWSEKMRITSNGRVGIGTDTPLERLHVDGYSYLSNSTGGYPFIRFNNTVTGGNTGLEFKENSVNKAWLYYEGDNNSLNLTADNAGGWSPDMVIKNGGNIGLGTFTPSARLHVIESEPGYTAAFGTPISPWNVGTNVGIGNDNEDAVLYVGQSPGNEGFLIWQYNTDPALGYYSIGTYNGDNNLTLQEYGGNVGIRTNSPAALFHVAEESPGHTAIFGTPVSSYVGGTNVSIGDDNASSLIHMGQSNDNKGFIIWNYNSTPSNAYFSLGTYSGSNPLVLQEVGGNVGIDVTSPLARLHVDNTPGTYTGLFGDQIGGYSSGTNISIGDDAATSLIYLGQGYNNKGFLIWNYDATPANAYFNIGSYGGSNPLILQPPSIGNVGIGTTSPVSRLQVNFDNNGNNYLGYSAIYPAHFYHIEQVADGDGQAGVYALRSRSAQNDGTGYSIGMCNTAMKGYSIWGDLYSFGTAGFNWNDFSRCGGVLGAEKDGYYWGALGYKNSGSAAYGGYFTSSTIGTGKSSGQADTGIGIGAWGDLMGADIHGKVYGVYAEGENYAMFSNGDVYKNKLDVHLQNNGTGTNTVLYTNVSTDVTVQTSGVATLSNGRANIAFDPSFAASVSSEAPVIVTVTPIGNSNGVYLAEVSAAGFTVVENNAGKSNVTVNYIAIGKRAGYEHPNLPREVIDAGYTGKLASGLHNDADTETNGQGLYYENGELIVGIHPSTLPDPNKPAAETVIPKPSTPSVEGMNFDGISAGPIDPSLIQPKFPEYQKPADGSISGAAGEPDATQAKTPVKAMPDINSAGSGNGRNESLQKAVQNVVPEKGSASEISSNPSTPVQKK